MTISSPRWGILGTGGIAAAMTRDLQLDGHVVAAVGSRTADAAARFAAAHGLERPHGSYEELVTDPEVDVVYVATPHPQHAPNALLALGAGKHVLVEKPFTMNQREAQQIADASRAAGLVALEAMWSRWLPHMERLQDIIRDGALGELRSVVAHHVQLADPDPAGRMLNPALGGGALLDLGIYPVSFAWDVLGAPSEVLALSTPSATGVDRQTSILLGYSSGAQAALTSELDAAGDNSAMIVGTDARVELDATFYAPTSFRVVGPKGNVIESYESRIDGRGMQYQARAIERLIAAGGGEDTRLPLAQSVAIMGTMDTIRERIGLV
ncbi:Gfo/Idh/MocA family oxidoreductase [Herbiconiux sp. CPCC 205763]|uniref:Gfo/Idh/MocA family oxidoreductase n=1 Tax=Herbiconiux aconitum TaxID=2970913 RepID=A0ABT2GN82_9MICO|nr:Gfo/Idh/MocA family oxidoreductase [Herbiconiux aconitum]MCS5717688.1 Gfo/Idh/MocA family oxidoreductase [Herbiconiux aconitum]